MLLRQLVSIAILPFMVTVLVPLWISRSASGTFNLPDNANALALVAVGALCLGAGLWLFVTTVTLLWRIGGGTLAPWDPPRAFVVAGPYRYLRHPMICGVVLILIGEVLILRSPPLGEWAATFLTLNLIYIPLVEEPRLEERFGDPYREYKRHVRMFVARATPYDRR